MSFIQASDPIHPRMKVQPNMMRTKIKDNFVTNLKFEFCY